jgi:hypothetical protein
MERPFAGYALKQTPTETGYRCAASGLGTPLPGSSHLAASLLRRVPHLGRGTDDPVQVEDRRRDVGLGEHVVDLATVVGLVVE